MSEAYLNTATKIDLSHHIDDTLLEYTVQIVDQMFHIPVPSAVKHNSNSEHGIRSDLPPVSRLPTHMDFKAEFRFLEDRHTDKLTFECRRSTQRRQTFLPLAKEAKHEQIIDTVRQFVHTAQEYIVLIHRSSSAQFTTTLNYDNMASQMFTTTIQTQHLLPCPDNPLRLTRRTYRQ